MKVWRKPFAAMVCAVVLHTTTGPVVAQNAQWNALFDRIIRLEAKVRTMQQGSGGALAPRTGGGAASGQMRALLNEMRQMRLRLESMDARLRALERRQGRQGRLTPPAPRQPATVPNPPATGNFSARDLEQFNAPAPQVFVEMGDPKPFVPPAVSNTPGTPGAAPKTTGQWQTGTTGKGRVASVPPVTAPPGTPNNTLSPQGVERRTLDGNQVTARSAAQVLFDRSRADLRSRRFGAAEAGFKSLLSRYSRDKLAADAQFMLGETYYAQKNYRLAAQAYLRGYRKFPRARRAADTLLKLGMTLEKLGQKSQACGAFEQVQSKYKSAGQTARLARQEMKRAGC